jgi:hypothetical protein
MRSADGHISPYSIGASTPAFKVPGSTPLERPDSFSPSFQCFSPNRPIGGWPRRLEESSFVPAYWRRERRHLMTAELLRIRLRNFPAANLTLRLLLAR